MNTHNDFTELKRLFNGEIARLAHLQREQKDYAVAPIIASLLGGFTIDQAKSFLFQASEIFTCTHTVNASEIHKKMGWGSLSR